MILYNLDLISFRRHRAACQTQTWKDKDILTDLPGKDGEATFRGRQSSLLFICLFYYMIHDLQCYVHFRLPWWLRRYSVCLQCRRPGFDPWVGKIPWRRRWQSTPVLLPGKSHGHRSLVGYSPWGRKESSSFQACSKTVYTYICIYVSPFILLHQQQTENTVRVLAPRNSCPERQRARASLIS